MFGIANASLVCRAWHTRCAPLLYSRLCVDASRVNVLDSCLRNPGNHLVRHARVVKIFGKQPWIASSKLSKLLPRVTLFFCRDSAEERVITYHPLHSRIIAGHSFTYANVKALAFMNSTFSSSRDLLCMLGALPSLSVVALEAVSFQSTSIHTPFTKYTQIRCIETKECDHAWLLSTFWTWRHRQEDPVAGGFPGLPTSEMRVITGILRCINNVGGQQLHIDRSLSDSKTWVLWLFKQGFHVEFHARVGATQPGLLGGVLTRPSLRIRHVVIRYHGRSIDKHFVHAGYGKDMETIDELLSQLSHLESVSLETSGMTLTYSDFRVKAKLDRVRTRTRLILCKQAHVIALQAQAAVAMDGSDTQYSPPYISPFWLLPRYERNRAWWLRPF